MSRDKETSEEKRERLETRGIKKPSSSIHGSGLPG